MDSNLKTLMKVGSRELAFRLAFKSVLRRLAKEVGPDRAGPLLDELEAIYVRDAKNFIPTENVPDDVQLECIDLSCCRFS